MVSFGRDFSNTASSAEATLLEVQIIGSIVSIITQVGVKYYLFTVVPDICEQGQKSQLTCPTVGTVFTASVVWYVVDH